MKKSIKQKKGISLIVLVITIIVMIILASAIILSLQSSGIIGRANEAKSKSDIANAKDVVSLAYAEWELDQESLKDTYSNFSEYAMAQLDEAGFDTDSMYVTEEGELLTGPAAFFTKNNVAIGTEVIGYTLNSITSYTTNGKENTSDDANMETNPQPATYTRDTNITWNYFGVDENGNVLIVGSVTDTTPKITLGGIGGYLNGPSTLKTICETMYSSDMGEARSINWEDVTRLLEYEGYEGTYYDASSNEIKTDKALTIGEIETKLGKTLSYRTTPDGNDIASFKSDYIRLLKTSTDIKVGDIIKNLVFQSVSYWLSSPCALALLSDSGVSFGVRYVEFDFIDSPGLYRSWGDSGCWHSYALRPIVKLASDVNVSYSNGVVSLSK